MCREEIPLLCFTYLLLEIIMTNEQKTMQENAPAATEATEAKSGFFTKKRVLIGVGVVAGVAATAVIGPKIFTKVKAARAAKAAIDAAPVVAEVASEVV